MFHAIFAAAIVTIAVYSIYQRFFHPLAKFPGPFWASVTDGWNVKEWISGQQPYRLTALHAKYGPIVRYGPNRLSFTSSDAVNSIYVKGSKTMPKTEFYDTFGNAKNPNLFNQRGIEAHGWQRRTILKSFSPQAVEKYESIIDAHLQRFRSTLRKFSDSGASFDLKDKIYLFMCDIVGDLIYGQDFNVQRTGLTKCLPDDHRIARWGAALGAFPRIHLIAPLLLFLTPHPQTGFRRNTLSYMLEAFKYVKLRRQALKDGVDTHRDDVITHMLNTNQEDGEKSLSASEVDIQLFGFVFAGVHPPAASTDMLFWHLLHNPEIMQQVSREVDENLPRMTAHRHAYSVADVERQLPYLRTCMKEAFRMTPAFTMPLPRRVTNDDTFINGERIPKGTSVAMCNHAFHHNAEVWGSDHGIFDPSRWDRDEYRELGKLMMHFGAGPRQCIGRTLATSIIYKLTSTVLAEFTVRLADPEEQSRAEAGAFYGEMPKLESVGISDLHGPLMVVAKRKHQEKE